MVGSSLCPMRPKGDIILGGGGGEDSKIRASCRIIAIMYIPAAQHNTIPHISKHLLPNPTPNTYNPHPSISLIKQAICALFAASATRLESFKKGFVSSWLEERWGCCGRGGGAEVEALELLDVQGDIEV